MNPMPDRREWILMRSAELFATRGIASTTVREIGDAAGVLSGSLYHYFRSKHAIVSEVLTRYMEDIHERFSAALEAADSPEDAVCRLIRATLLVIDDHPHPTAIYQNDRQYLRDHGLLEPVDSSSRKVRDYWMEALRDGVASGAFRDDIPPDVFYRTVRDSLWSSMHWPSRKSYPTADFTDLMISLFFQGFGARK